MTDIYQHTSRLIVLFEEFLHYEYLIQQMGVNYLLMRIVPLGSVLAIRTNINDVPSFQLVSKQSEVTITTEDEESTGIKRGERILTIIWFDRLSENKYIRLDDLVHVSVSSVLVARSRITWERTTTNRYYLGEHTQSLLMDTVNNLGEI